MEQHGATARSIASGMTLGGVLSLCNIYSGLKVGFTTNMSITAALAAFALFWGSHKLFGTRPIGRYENTLQQTAASAAATIAGSGLVAGIPALTMLTGRKLAYGWLMSWVLNVSVLGVLVGLSLRRTLIVRDSLPFPYGLATAELLEEIYARGAEAVARARVLVAGVFGAGLAKACAELWALSPWAPRLRLLSLQGQVFSAQNLGVALDPSLLMVGVGALIGLRAGLSMLLGAVIAWGVLAPRAVLEGHVVIGPDRQESLWFHELSSVLIWPGVSLMVSAALTSFLLSLRSVGRRDPRPHTSPGAHADAAPREPRLALAFALAGLCSITLQKLLFDIPLYAGFSAVGLSFALALVAARVTGETGIAPIGAMGKITQLLFALLHPGNPTSNLMAANVTGGAASQCADMLHDLKTGHLLSIKARHQALSQLFGVLSGALFGSAGYLLMVPHPETQLISRDWPAPAVAQWKAVAELFTRGLQHLPHGSLAAAVAAACVGILLSLGERFLPPRLRALVPSAASIGLAFVLPAYYALSVCLGALLAAGYARVAPRQAERFTTTLASGVIAGESLVGVGFAVARML